MAPFTKVIMAMGTEKGRNAAAYLRKPQNFKAVSTVLQAAEDVYGEMASAGLAELTAAVAGVEQAKRAQGAEASAAANPVPAAAPPEVAAAAPPEAAAAQPEVAAAAPEGGGTTESKEAGGTGAAPMHARPPTKARSPTPRSAPPRPKPTRKRRRGQT